jgi:hypothetical protein
MTWRGREGRDCWFAGGQIRLTLISSHPSLYKRYRGLLISKPMSNSKPTLIRILSKLGFLFLKYVTLYVHIHIDMPRVLLVQ